MASRHISVPKPFAAGDTDEWFQRFEICCRVNGWNEETKALKLPTLLEGEALAVWLELTAEQQVVYDTAKNDVIADRVCIIVLFTAFQGAHTCVWYAHCHL